MENLKVCIYINNYGTFDISLPDLSLINPGIGGSQYEMFLLAQQLQKNNIAFKLLLTHPQKSEINIKYDIVGGIEEAFDYCNENDIDYIILRANDGINCLESLNKTKIIYWIHNFIDYKSATIIAKSSKVKKVVFVSQEEADFYYDHDISKKGHVIFNAIPSTNENNSSKEKENIVTFIGDISPYKMLDKLTAIWPKIIKKVPDAKLLVLGSGDLYGKGKKFGQYNIAEEQYEKVVLKPLLKHNLMGTVTFVGLVKGDMHKKISNSKVTVFMNPIETFCIAATDSINNGVPVVCPKSTGYCDVVTTKTGSFFKTKKGAIKRIVAILKNKKIFDMSKANLEYLKEFSAESFYSKWAYLLSSLNNEKQNKKIYHKKNRVNHKSLVIFLRFIRKIFHLPNGFSRIGIKWHIKLLIKK